jgi:inosine/xanthosine triphosphate pyrophosphatase family protein
MAKQTINIGTSANAGDGDPLRSAFDKINDNFDEVYSDIASLAAGNVVSDLKGSVFADDSTLLVDAVNGVIVGPIVSTGVLTGSVIGTVDGDLTGSVFADDSTLLVDAVNGEIPGYVSLATLQSVVAASADFADFQTRIAAL